MPNLNRQLGIRLPLVLASGSPRREKLLKSVGFDFSIFKPEIDEDNISGSHTPATYVCKLAETKAWHSAEHIVQDSVVISADTIVAYNEVILGKPDSPIEAIQMLQMLSGKTHSVYTGYCILDMQSKTSIINHCKTDVTFRELEEEEIERYVNSGSPMDKAGSYGIQEDLGSVFVESIKGDYFNVVGLPLQMVYMSLKNMSI
ncbi:MAG: Maf family protein [Candidatus Kapaibacteriales bacterium]